MTKEQQVKKQRSLRELLILVSKSEEIYITQECTGLCKLIDVLFIENKITMKECNILIDYFIYNRPKRGPHRAKDRNLNTMWWWPVCEWEPRKAWLDSRISLKRIR